jgi:hypothetical protein
MEMGRLLRRPVKDQMTHDGAPKSAYELAMERLKKQDAEAGITSTPLTDEQKASIAEVRNYYEAKIAEQTVLHQSAMRRSVDIAERQAMEEQFRREYERLTSDRERKIENIRRGRQE